MALVTPGITTTGTPASRQAIDLFAPAAEDEGIAAFEPHDVSAVEGAGDQHPLDLLLRHRVVARRLADVDELGAGGPRVAAGCAGRAGRSSTTSASRSAALPARVSSPSSPGPPPTSVTRPTAVVASAGSRLSQVRRARQAALSRASRLLVDVDRDDEVDGRDQRRSTRDGVAGKVDDLHGRARWCRRSARRRSRSPPPRGSGRWLGAIRRQRPTMRTRRSHRSRSSSMARPRPDPGDASGSWCPPA